MIYDYTIIGGGSAGLYANYLLSKKNKTLLLEKNDYFGGRILDVKFHGNTIKLGAGIGALHNKYLLKLLKEINIEYKVFKGNTSIVSKDKNKRLITRSLIIIKLMHKMVKNIIKKYKSLSLKKTKYMTSKEFIVKYFGKKFFKFFATYAEYTDFFNTSIESLIKYYPITDHIPCKYNIVYIDWNLLVNRLIKKSKDNSKLNKPSKLVKNYEVNTIKYNDKTNTYLINNEYETKNIVFAITIKGLTNIINKSKILNINFNDYIGYVPFIRIYTYHKNGHGLTLDRYSITDSKLHKILIISDKILMVAYCDNKNALYWYKYFNNKKLLITKLRTEVKKTLNHDLQIDDIKTVYWDEGVHFYKPKSGLKVIEIIKKLSNPAKNIYICGEMLSKKQGWVEGAIQSAYDIYKMTKKNNN